MPRVLEQSRSLSTSGLVRVAMRQCYVHVRDHVSEGPRVRNSEAVYSEKMHFPAAASPFSFLAFNGGGGPLGAIKIPSPVPSLFLR